MRTLSCFLALGLVSSGCGDDSGAGGGTNTTASTGAGGEAQGGGGSGVGGGVGVGGGGGEGGDGPTFSACAQPTITPGASFDAPGGGRFASVRLASRGDAVDLVYAQEAATNQWEIRLQSLDGQGLAVGAPVIVGQASGAFAPPITVAKGDARSLVCFNVSISDFSCRTVEAGVAGPTLRSFSGQNPGLAAGAIGFALIFSAAPNLVAQPLDASGNVIGTPQTVLSGGAPFNPKLSKTSSGYASLETDALGILHRFDGAFVELEGNSVVGWPDSPFDLAASGNGVGTIYLATGVPTFKQVDGNNVETAPMRVDSAKSSTIYQHVGIAGAKASYAVVWSAFEGYMGYRAIDANGAPIGAVVQALSLNWDDNPVSIATVSDGFVAASATEIAQDAMRVVHLGCLP